MTDFLPVLLLKFLYDEGFCLFVFNISSLIKPSNI